MHSLHKNLLLWALSLGLFGCTAVTPHVSTLGGISAPFHLPQGEIRVSSIIELNNITITAKCFLNQTQFEVEFPDTSPPVTWSLVPISTMTSPFVSVLNNCSSNQTLTLQLDLQSFMDFSSIFSTTGSFRTIRFRDSNVTGVPFTAELRVIYSPVTLKRERFIFGQGSNNTICRTGKCLQGRLVNQDQNKDMVGSINTNLVMRGRVIWQ
jgi:hypothetical protein